MRALPLLAPVLVPLVACGSADRPSAAHEVTADSGALTDAAPAQTSTPPPPARPPRAHRTIPGPTPAEVTLVTEEFTVAPGQETFRCQNFDNPFGADVDIVQSEHTMSEGSHHLFVFDSPGAYDDPMTVCGGLEYARYVHSSQRPHQVFDYPPGWGGASRTGAASACRCIT